MRRTRWLCLLIVGLLLMLAQSASAVFTRMQLLTGERVYQDPTTGMTLGSEGWHWRYVLQKRRNDRLEAAIYPRMVRASVVRLARSYLGVPYLWGGSSPQIGLDCSGLTALVLGQVGVQLPHMASAQQDLGIHVTDPQPGDLVFYGNPAHHVSIYVGGNREIEASSSDSPVRYDRVEGQIEYRSYLPRA